MNDYSIFAFEMMNKILDDLGKLKIQFLIFLERIRFRILFGFIEFPFSKHNINFLKPGYINTGSIEIYDYGIC